MKPALVCFLSFIRLPDYLFGAGDSTITPFMFSGSRNDELKKHESEKRIFHQPKQKETIHKLSVLLADDDKDDQDLFRDAIAEINPAIQIEVVDDGLELMQKLRSGESRLPDVIFLDLNMPCKNGKECLSEIRSEQELQKIPVIIFSTSQSSKDIHETQSKGADLYMRKPNSFSALVQMVKKVIALDFEKYRNNPERGDFLVVPSGI